MDCFKQYKNGKLSLFEIYTNTGPFSVPDSNYLTNGQFVRTNTSVNVLQDRETGCRGKRRCVIKDGVNEKGSATKA